jgi:TPR repeat protein
MLLRMVPILLALFFAILQSPAKSNAPAMAQTTVPLLTPAEITALQSAATTGDAAAQYRLALAYENGDGVPKNLSLAFQWCKKAADQGNSGAETNLGVMYRLGEGVDENRAIAVQWYEKASRQGNANAMFDLGTAYYNGDGVPIDDSLSYAWFILAKEGGNPQAVQAVARAESDLTAGQITVGYRDIAELCNDGTYLPKNEAEAASWWLKSATRGDYQSQIKLAMVLLNGQGVPQDFSKARYWCGQAAKSDDRLTKGSGEYCMGHIYQYGLGTPVSAKTARKWHQLAAEAGLVVAIRTLAQMEESGEGGKVDLVGASVLYTELAMGKPTDKPALQQLVRLKNKMSAKQWNELQKRLSYYHIDPRKFYALLLQAPTP